MAADSLSRIPEEVAPAPARKLTRRATLAAANGIATQIVQFLVGFGVTPLVARTLGQADFGLWTLLWQLNNYLSLGQFRVANLLKLRLAAGQGRMRDGEKRRLLTATLWLVLWFMVPLLAVTALVAFQVDRIFTVGPDGAGAAAAALLLISLALAVNQVGGVAGGILRGENVEYAFAGVPALTLVAISGLSVLLLELGCGIVGLGLANVAGQVLAAVLTWRAARKAAPWIGLAPTGRAEIFQQARESGWSVVSTTSQMVLSNFDLMLVGTLFGAASAAEYYVAGALSRFLQLPVATAIGVVGSGLAGLFASGDRARLARANREFAVLALVASAAAGSVVVGLNGGFVRLWMGAEYGASLALSGCVLASSVALVFVNSAMNLFDAAIEFRRRTLYLWLGIAGGAAVGLVGAAEYGLAGFAGGQFAGRALVWLGLRLHLARVYGVEAPLPGRLLGATVVVWSAAAALGLRPGTWPQFFGCGALLGFGTLGFVCTAGLARGDREALVARARQMAAAVSGIITRRRP